VASIDGFLEALASRTPAPGGGAASALCGAVACALGEMVARYSISPGVEPAGVIELEAIGSKLMKCRVMLRRCMEEDAAAYEALVAARRERRNHPETQGLHQSAVLAAATVPLETVAAAVTALTALDELRPKSNPHLVSDLAAAAILAVGCVESAAHQVEVNLPHLEDASTQESLRADLRSMRLRAGQLGADLRGATRPASTDAREAAGSVGRERPAR